MLLILFGLYINLIGAYTSLDIIVRYDNKYYGEWTYNSGNLVSWKFDCDTNQYIFDNIDVWVNQIDSDVGNITIYDKINHHCLIETLVNSPTQLHMTYQTFINKFIHIQYIMNTSDTGYYFYFIDHIDVGYGQWIISTNNLILKLNLTDSVSSTDEQILGVISTVELVRSLSRWYFPNNNQSLVNCKYNSSSPNNTFSIVMIISLLILCCMLCLCCIIESSSYIKYINLLKKSSISNQYIPID